MKISTLLACCSAALYFTPVTGALHSNPNKLSNCTTAGVVAYTIDDGPGYYTEDILNILKKENVSATFFLKGEKIGNNRTIIQNIINGGHQIALHGYTHKSFDSMSALEIFHDLTNNSNLINTLGGVRPRFMRAPHDECGPACQNVTYHMGLLEVNYNIDTYDWKFAHRNGPGSDFFPEDVSTHKCMASLNKTLKNADPKTDSIILLQHETHAFSVKLLPKVIKAVRAKGFEFVPLAECLHSVPYKQCLFKRTYPDDHATKTNNNSTTPDNTGKNSTKTGTSTPTTTGNTAQVNKVALWTLGLVALLVFLLA
ncbi:chitin deacetylase [Mortierella alpina]|nr:chitin deacetylase [Mortierella alpina]KAF9957811.1 chitin deacetylase [Mortierella alpina]